MNFKISSSLLTTLILVLVILAAWLYTEFHKQFIEIFERIIKFGRIINLWYETRINLSFYFNDTY